jgi:hypothetical protein
MERLFQSKCHRGGSTQNAYEIVSLKGAASGNHHWLKNFNRVDEGATRRIKSLFILSAVVAVGMMRTVPALSAETHRAELEAVVDPYLAACEAKSAMLDSRSKNIRRSALRAYLRATFYRTSRAGLIDELVVSNAGPEPHKGHHFPNARFNEVVGATDLAPQ